MRICRVGCASENNISHFIGAIEPFYLHSPVTSKLALVTLLHHASQGYLPGQLYNLNSKFGNQEELKELCAALKEAGVRPVCDIVINHRCADAQDEHGIWNQFKCACHCRRFGRHLLHALCCLACLRSFTTCYQQTFVGAWRLKETLLIHFTRLGLPCRHPSIALQGRCGASGQERGLGPLGDHQQRPRVPRQGRLGLWRRLRARSG